jgi:glycosyltransferase involved in cell wall biosynthesis
MKETVGILVVNYNNLNFTKQCINSILNQINPNYKLCVVDQNSSEEGTKEYLNILENKGIKVIRNNHNSDLNKVWNYFYKNSDTEYVCFLNNDVVVTNNFVDDIIKIFDKEPTVGAVLHSTNNLRHNKVLHNLSYKILNPPLYQGWDFCLRRDAYLEIPDTLRIFGGDDLIFANLVNKGYKIALSFSSPIIHYKERTRVKISNISTIQKNDQREFWNQMRARNLKHIGSTLFDSNLSVKYPPKGMNLIQNKNCIFTALIGNYDRLTESTVGKQDNWDYICFTDNKDLTSDFWKIIYVENIGETIIDNYKLARHFKTNYHKYLNSYDNLIWKDARIIINSDLNKYLEKLGDDDIIFMRHPHAHNINDEMNRVIDCLEKKEIIDKIKDHYKEEGYNYDNGLIASGIMLFKNNEKIKKFFIDWWDEIKNYSHRDQLSANFALWKNREIKPKYLNFYKVLSLNGKFMPGKRLTKNLIINEK